MNDFTTNTRHFFSSRGVRLTAGVVGALLVAALIFHAHRGEFGRFGRERGFRPPFFPVGIEFPRDFISGGHGAVGTITALTLPTFALETREGTSETILVGTSTLIRSRGTGNAQALSAGDQVVVLGEPDSQGRIDAKFIRILPPLSPAP